MARRHAVGCGLALLACLPAAVSGMRVLPSVTHPALRSCAPVACAPAPVDDAAAATGAKEEELSPQQAVKELGSLFEQVKAVWVDGKTWSADERVERRRAIVTSYVRVFAPAVSFSGVQLSLSLGWLAFLFVALSASGLGYDSILSLTEGLPPLHDALGAIDPGWGNLAIALVGALHGANTAAWAMSLYLSAVHLPLHYLRLFLRRRFVGLALVAIFSFATLLTTRGWRRACLSQAAQRVVVAHVWTELALSMTL